MQGKLPEDETGEQTEIIGGRKLLERESWAQIYRVKKKKKKEYKLGIEGYLYPWFFSANRPNFQNIRGPSCYI